MAVDFNIRKADENDAELVHAFVHKLADYERLTEKATSTVEDIREALAGERPRINSLILEHEKNPVGFAVYFFTYTTFAGRPKLFVEDIFVDPDKRLQGAGGELFLELVRIAKINNCVRMEMQVLDWNDSAVDFYEKRNAEFVTNWLPYSLECEHFDPLLGR